MKTFLFPGKGIKDLPWVGFEPTTLLSTKQSTNWATCIHIIMLHNIEPLEVEFPKYIGIENAIENL